MPEYKFERNRLIVQSREAGKTYAAIAKEHGLNLSHVSNLFIDACDRMKRAVSEGEAPENIATQWAISIEFVNQMIDRSVKKRARLLADMEADDNLRAARVEWIEAPHLPSKCPKILLSDLSDMLDIARDGGPVQPVEIYDLIEKHFEDARGEFPEE